MPPSMNITVRFLPDLLAPKIHEAALGNSVLSAISRQVSVQALPVSESTSIQLPSAG